MPQQSSSASKSNINQDLEEVEPSCALQLSFAVGSDYQEVPREKPEGAEDSSLNQRDGTVNLAAVTDPCTVTDQERKISDELGGLLPFQDPEQRNDSDRHRHPKASQLTTPAQPPTNEPDLGSWPL